MQENAEITGTSGGDRPIYDASPARLEPCEARLTTTPASSEQSIMATSHGRRTPAPVQAQQAFTSLGAPLTPVLALYDEWPCYGTNSPADAIQAGCRYVYFIHCPDADAVKIGLAWNPRERLRQIQSGNPLQLKLIFVIETESSKDAVAFEAMCHRAFEPWRIRGEWFRYAEEVSEFMQAAESVLN
jgi:hypothetical protein